MIWPFTWPPFPWWQLVVTILGVAVSTAATVHVLLRKRETRAAIGWIGLIWLSPFVGSLIYVLLGINRIKRKARALRRNRPAVGRLDPRECSDECLREALRPDREYLTRLARLVGIASGRRLLEGNRITPLDNGEECYPAMIRAIDAAEKTVTLLTYIFRDDRAGKPVADALERARERGVEVRVLIDGLGSVHEGAPIVTHLQSLGLNVALFIPTLRPGWVRYANLRNHRKVLIVDGRIGFTGGMNILDDFLPPDGDPGGDCCRDVHFEVQGPVVAALQQVFADDWAFTTGEVLEGDRWFPAEPEPIGPTIARIVAGGPDLEYEMLGVVLQGALSVARDSVTIVTPYFIPDAPLLAALATAALRGVEVDILLPSRNNHRIVQWAGLTLLEPLLEAGCRVWMTPAPFEHTKLMIVDGIWSLIGSANWDPRSLVLNFELNVECYDRELAAALWELVDGRRRQAHRLSLDELQDRSIWLKLRDNLARLLSPYL